MLLAILTGTSMAGAAYTSESVNEYSLDSLYGGASLGNFIDFDNSS